MCLCLLGQIRLRAELIRRVTCFEPCKSINIHVIYKIRIVFTRPTAGQAVHEHAIIGRTLQKRNTFNSRIQMTVAIIIPHFKK